MILVDPIREHDNGPGGHRYWCHMGTDDHTDVGLAELHVMAVRIGLRRAWFQNKLGFPHYDLTPALRATAVRAGAQEVGMVEYVRRTKRQIQR